MNGPCTTIRQYRDRDQSIQNDADAELEEARQEADSFSFGRRQVQINTSLTGEKSVDIESVFKKFDNDFLEFDLVENKLSQRPDLHAFLLLASLVPGTHDMVAAAEHDEIYLSIEAEDLAKVATEDQIRDLRRCGVRLADDGLCMFV